MAYCGPRGIPHWHFLGGPPVWTAHDRAAALAWSERHARTCRSCGTHPDMWDTARGGRPDAFEWRIETGCAGCAVLAVGERRLEQGRERGRYAKDAQVALVPRAVEVSIDAGAGPDRRA